MQDISLVIAITLGTVLMMYGTRKRAWIRYMVKMGQGPGPESRGAGLHQKGIGGQEKKGPVYSNGNRCLFLYYLPIYFSFFTPFFIYFITKFIREKYVYLYTPWIKAPILLTFLRLQIGYREVYRYTGLRTASKELTHHESVNCHPRRIGQPQIVTNSAQVTEKVWKSYT